MKIAKTIGVAWCGLYNDNQLGWVLPEFLDPTAPTALSSLQQAILARIGEGKEYCPQDMYRVLITIEALKDKRGRYIIKRAKKRNEK